MMRILFFSVCISSLSLFKAIRATCGAGIFGVSLFTVLFGWGCADSDDSQKSIDSQSPTENVISELEKAGNYKTFIQALKTIELKDTPVTVFAIQDEVFESTTRNSSDFSVDDLNRHIAKGAYTDLAAINSLRTIGNEELEVETATVTISGVEKQLIYLNQTIVNADYKKIGDNVIYSVNKMFSKKTQSPSTAEVKDYLEWFGKRMEGTWILDRMYYYYRIFYSETHTELFEGQSYNQNYIGNYFEKFSWDVVDKEQHIYGDYSIASPDFFSLSTKGQVRNENGKWGIDFYTSSTFDNIMLTDYFYYLDYFYLTQGNILIDKEYGVGKEMKYLCPISGYSLNPPNMYPSRRDSAVYVLKKIAN